MLKKINKILALCLSISLGILISISCIRQPNSPNESNNLLPAKSGAYILCEGLMGRNNSTISRFDADSSVMLNDFFTLANPSLKLGDTGNDMIIFGDTAWVAVTMSQSIESFRVSDGKWLNRLILTGHRAPRRICRINDSIAFVTDLYTHTIVKFNPSTMNIIEEGIPTGPAPEYICSIGDNLFVANSGYGDYLKDLPKAGTISVISLTSLQEKKVLNAGQNVIELQSISIQNKLFAVFYNLPSKVDSVGGIIEYDAQSLTEIRRWNLYARSLKVSPDGSYLYFLDSMGVGYIDLSASDPQPENLIINPNKNDKWYSLAVSPDGNYLWVGDAMNYQIDGEILIYSLSNLKNYMSKYSVGINPGKIVFF